MTEHVPATAEGLPGFHNFKEPVGAIANVVSLINVCTFALEAIEDWRKDIRERAAQDIRHTLNLAACYGTEASVAVERALAGKGGDE